MRAGVRLKLFGISLALVLGVGLASGIFLEQRLRRWLLDRIETELLARARMARDLIEVAPEAASPGVADELADRMGESTGARVTIVHRSGSVLGDSELSLEQVRHVENHGQRPEVVEALAHGRGATRRYSTSVGTDMLYVAVPFSRPSHSGVVRVSMPLSELDSAVNRLRLVLGATGLVGLLLAVSISGITSDLASRPLRSLVHSARLVRAGRLGEVARLPISSNDEIGSLAGSFNELVRELEQTLESLASERERLETILEGMTEALLALDRNDRVTHANRAALRLLGLGQPPIGQSLVEVVRTPALGDLLEKVHREPFAIAESELLLGLSRQVLARAAPIKSTGGAIVVMLDISEIRRLENVRRDFAANVSHELRTPVSVIQANAETLLAGALGDPNRGSEFLDAILRNARRLSRLVSDLLDLSRIESGHFTLNVQPTSVAAAVHRAIDSIRGLAADKRLDVSVDADERLRVLADGSALDQVLTNLVVNAVKYTPEGGHVEVRARAGDLPSGNPAIVIEVCDDGAGIAPRHRARIFERFYRVDPGRSREMGGTGLGLAIVKHLVNAMQGEVTLTDNAAGGSIFRVTLAAARSSRGPIAEARAHDASPNL